MPTPKPTIYLIAGCNGAGKTTFAKEFLLHEVKCLRFYNADEIARGLQAASSCLKSAHQSLAANVRAGEHVEREDLRSHLRICSGVRLRIGTGHAFWGQSFFSHVTPGDNARSEIR